MYMHVCALVTFIALLDSDDIFTFLRGGDSCGELSSSSVHFCTSPLELAAAEDVYACMCISNFHSITRFR